MKNVISLQMVILVLLFKNYSTFAQVKIGANSAPAASAVLELESNSNKGFLGPKVALTSSTDVTTIASPATGLMVYNTATSGTSPNNVIPGYYYYTGVAWVSMNGTNNIYTNNGSLTGNRTVTQGANTLAFTSTAANGFSVDGTTFSVNASANRVGVGSTSPLTRLHIAGDGSTDYREAALYFENTGSLGRNYTIASRESGKFIIVDEKAALARLTIDSNGYVGIGTSSPFNTLTVKSADAYTSRFESTSSDPSGVIAVVVPLSNTTCNTCTQLMVFDKINGTNMGSINANLSASSVSYNTTSDIRLKENIKTTHYSVQDLMKIEVADYTRKNDSTHTLETGYLAQQLYSVFPYAVTTGGEDANTNPWGVDYGRITPLLVKSIQDQQRELEAQKLENKEIKTALEQLKAEIAVLKANSNQVSIIK